MLLLFSTGFLEVCVRNDNENVEGGRDKQKIGFPLTNSQLDIGTYGGVLSIGQKAVWTLLMGKPMLAEFMKSIVH